MYYAVAVLAAVTLLWSAASEAKTKCKDSKTGQYVSHSYAAKYPGLTQCHKVR